MFDHGSTRGSRPSALIWQSLRTRLPAQPIDQSDRHCWLMRRDLGPQERVDNRAHTAIREGFSIRDAVQIHQLLTLGYQNGGGSVPAYSDWLRAFENDPEFDPALCYSLWNGPQLAGVIQCCTSAFIKDLVVHPRARRQGVGLALLNQAFTTFSLRGEGAVDLNVIENNLAARRLYEKAGMRYVQRREMTSPCLA
ncbi:GNAT family N-acetyltransferase [Pseudomonas sp. DWP3-1-2]|uniref:GNAT family N-acetyltransferase n=1 Tax=Pseudomonas sp. DWP3-1-2 TaxID=2804645 RepID=UPI003CFB95D1